MSETKTPAQIAADKQAADNEKFLAESAKKAEKAAKEAEPVEVAELPADAILEQPKEYVTFEDGKQFVTKTGEKAKKSKKED